MKLKLTTDCNIHVLDVSMPILRTTVRNDLRLIAKIASDEHKGKVSGREGEAIREMLGMKSNTWQRILEEGERAHSLWQDGQLTEKGKRCSNDGMVLDHEDGPHRLWVIEAQQPIGLKIIHIEAWSDIEISSNSIGETHRGGLVQNLRKEGAVHESILDSTNRCRFRPPSWWVRWMKRDPAVQEHPELSTQGRISCSWGLENKAPEFSFSGPLKGMRKGAVSAEGAFEVARPPAKNQMQGLVSDVLSNHLEGSQTWDEKSNCLRTDISSLNDKQAIHDMKKDLLFGSVEQQPIGYWERGALEGIQLRARSLETAREWASTLYWNQNDAIHRTEKQVATLIQALSKKSALEEFSLEFDIKMRQSLMDSLEAPDGAKWFFHASEDLSQAIGAEVRQ
jgi:hypothetical protein